MGGGGKGPKTFVPRMESEKTRSRYDPAKKPVTHLIQTPYVENGGFTAVHDPKRGVYLNESVGHDPDPCPGAPKNFSRQPGMKQRPIQVVCHNEPAVKITEPFTGASGEYGSIGNFQRFSQVDANNGPIGLSDMTRKNDVTIAYRLDAEERAAHQSRLQKFCGPTNSTANLFTRSLSESRPPKCPQPPQATIPVTVEFRNCTSQQQQISSGSYPVSGGVMNRPPSAPTVMSDNKSASANPRFACSLQNGGPAYHPNNVIYPSRSPLGKRLHMFNAGVSIPYRLDYHDIGGAPNQNECIVLTRGANDNNWTATKAPKGVPASQPVGPVPSATNLNPEVFQRRTQNEPKVTTRTCI